MDTEINGDVLYFTGLSLTHDGFLVTLDTKPAREYLRLVIFNQDGSDSTWYPFYTSPHGYTPGSKCRFLAVNGETVIVSDLGKVVFLNDTKCLKMKAFCIVL